MGLTYPVWLTEYFADMDMPLCLNHNDFHLRNIIIEDETNAAYIIDYELAAMGYEQRDMAGKNEVN